MKTIDLETWKRKEHFKFFSGLDDPYWCMTTELDCTQTYRAAKEKEDSFFLSYLHKSLLAVNRVEELRLRIVEQKIICYDQIHASATILRADETFGCCFMEFNENYAEFSAAAKPRIKDILNRTGMCLENDYMTNQIHYSSIPWCHFTALTYTKSLKPQDSVPKITFGKKYQIGEQYKFPIAIQVHHGLVDGIHVARFLDYFQTLLNTD